jgi:hypothetical protein
VGAGAAYNYFIHGIFRWGSSLVARVIHCLNSCFALN